MSYAQYEDCIRECKACAVRCWHCLSEMATKESKNDCPRCCAECSEICIATARAMAQGSSYVPDFCALCAKICDWCAEQCEAHDHDHCKKCAEACRACAEQCRKHAA